MDFEKNIAEMREAFHSKQLRSEDHLRGKPAWVNAGEPVYQQYLLQEQLLTKGEVYYGALVQANRNLFRDDDTNYGAVVLIGADKLFDNNPFVLRGIARSLFEHKNKTDVPYNVAEFARLITDEREYVLNLPVPQELTNGAEVYFTTLIIDRRHLPQKRLTGGLFPVIASPDNLKPCMVLPHRFWTQDIKRFFAE